MSKVRILIGDVRARLAELPDRSVQCVVTSPPYWGLRDYGVEGQLGLEKTPEEYVANMVGVFREISRVLRDDGTLWLNMGDCYYTQPAGNKTASGFQQKSRAGQQGALAQFGTRKASLPKHKTLKQKDLVGMPWMLAFALRADGWYLRSDIIWSKSNPMPESVRDRPTKAHEYMFLLTKKGRYYYDQEAVREAHHTPPAHRAAKAGRACLRGQESIRPRGNLEVCGNPAERYYSPGGRNLRDVWTIPTQPFPEAHFATYPEALIIPCVKAGTSERGCCPECGAGWVRVVERKYYGEKGSDNPAVTGMSRNKLGGQKVWSEYVGPKTTGWNPGCKCTGGTTHVQATVIPVPCTVLDPFLGSGTTALVAARLGRDCVGIELSPEYAEIAQRRLDEVALMAQVEVK